MPDFYIQGNWQGKKYTKLIFELKTFDAENFPDMLEQVDTPSMFSIGNEGEYTKEFNYTTRDMIFSGSSQFVILIRGTQIAFLERYCYSLEDYLENYSGCMIPLTMPIDKTKGIENPRLAQIMTNYRHLCDITKPFPYKMEEGNNLNFPGKYYVFDLLLHSDACHELFMYVSSELPRLHGTVEDED